MNVKPVPTKFNPKKVISKNSEINNVTSPICIPQRTPTKRLYQDNQYESFISKDPVKDSKCLNESFSPVGIFLERMMTMFCFACPTFFQKGAYPIVPMVSPWKRLSFLSQKYVKKLSCFFTVAKGTLFFCILTITRT